MTEPEPLSLPEADVTTLSDYFDADGARHSMAYTADQMRAHIVARDAQWRAAMADAETKRFQGGMDNDELREAWAKKLLGVEPSDRDLTAFALGVEVGDMGARTYFAERNSARDAWRRAATERDELRAAMAAAVEAERERWTLLLTEKWHAGDGKGQTLAQYMGMSDSEYAAWVLCGLQAVPHHTQPTQGATKGQ